MTTVLIVFGDTVDLNMGGVGVRGWELANTLAASCAVTLAIPNPSGLAPEGFQLVSYDLQQGDLRPLCQGVDVILTHGFVLHFHPYLRELGIPLAIDLYVPFLLETLVWHAGSGFEKHIPAYEEYLRVQTELLRVGDFFFCASERQRDYWLGWLNALKRVNPHTLEADPSLRGLIDLVPFGLPAGQPAAGAPVLKGVLPGIAPTDRLILWSGGIWDWLDPLTLIRAMARLAGAHPELKLYFLGTRHPNPAVGGMEMPERAIRLSQELGLYQRSVFFGEWVPYQERGRYLAEADLAVITHLNHIETHFSFRTRVLDCIWAGLPILISDGDAISELVQREGLGGVVPAGDPAALALAIEQVLAGLQDSRYQAAFARVKEQFRWQQVVEPLRRFCLAPHFAADKGHYLTELERISRDKDSFSAGLLRERAEIIQQRDRAAAERDAFGQERQEALNARDAAISARDTAVQDRAEALRAQEQAQRERDQAASDRDHFWNLYADREALIARYHRTLPFRALAALKRLLRRS